MKTRVGIFILWISLLFLAKWLLEYWMVKDEQQWWVISMTLISAVSLILCLPMLLVYRYRNLRFVGYCAVSVLIGGLVMNAWWLGVGAVIASLFLSVLAFILEAITHTRLFMDRKGHGIWLLLFFHSLMMMPLNPTVGNLLGMDLDDALFISVIFPVTIWRFICTVLCVANIQYAVNQVN